MRLTDVSYDDTVAQYLTDLYIRLTDEHGSDWKATEVGQGRSLSAT